MAPCSVGIIRRAVPAGSTSSGWRDAGPTLPPLERRFGKQLASTLPSLPIWPKQRSPTRAHYMPYISGKDSEDDARVGDTFARDAGRRTLITIRCEGTPDEGAILLAILQRVQPWLLGRAGWLGWDGALLDDFIRSKRSAQRLFLRGRGIPEEKYEQIAMTAHSAGRYSRLAP